MTSKKNYLAEFLERDPKTASTKHIPSRAPYPISSKNFKYSFDPSGTFYLYWQGHVIDIIKTEKAKWFSKNCPLARFYSHKNAPVELIRHIYEGLFYNNLNCLDLYSFVSARCQCLAHFCLDCPYYYKFADSLS